MQEVIDNITDLSLVDDETRQIVQNWGFTHERDEILKVALQAQRFSKMRVGEIIVELGIVSEEYLQEKLEEKPQDIPLLSFISEDVPDLREGSILSQRILALRNLYPYFDTIDYSLHPLMRNNKQLFEECDKENAILLDIGEPSALLVFSKLNDLTNFQTQGLEAKLQSPIRNETGDQIILSVGNAQIITRQLSILRAEEKKTDLGDSSTGDNIWDESTTIESSALRKLSRAIGDSLARGVTDVAIDPERDGSSNIKVRLFGEMMTSPSIKRLDMSETHEVVRFLLQKSQAELQGARLIGPADGQFTFIGAGGECAVRASFIPLDLGRNDIETISMSLRLLPRSKGSGHIRLSHLNMHEQMVEESRSALSYSQGLIILAGPTNSGKSTTIAGMMGEHYDLFGNSKKRISLEDPVERLLPNILQISVPQQNKEAFPQLMKALLRHDPDLVWIGEVRDQLVAGTCVRAATSGHMVITTLHANDTVVAWKTLFNMIDHNLQMDLAESLSLIVGQRLVKKVCKKCGFFSEPTEEQQKIFSKYCKLNGIEDATIPEKLINANKEGCPQCHAGYSGVVPINELLPVSREAKTLMMEDKVSYSDVANHRIVTLFDSALAAAHEGHVELNDIFI